MAKIKQLTLKNYFFVSGLYQDTLSLAEWLVKQMLHGKESRERTRFVRLIGDKVQEVQDERLRLIKENSKKDEKGNQLFKDKDGKDTTDQKEAVSFSLEDEAKFNQAFADYLNEDYIVDILPGQADTINTVKSILLNTTEQFDGRPATMYEEWCTSFENIT